MREGRSSSGWGCYKGCCFGRVGSLSLLRVDNGGLETLELLGGNESDERVELLVLRDQNKQRTDGQHPRTLLYPSNYPTYLTHLGGILIIVATTLDPDANTVRNVLDTLSPNGGVEVDIEENLLGAHRLASELLDGLDGNGSTLFEREERRIQRTRKTVSTCHSQRLALSLHALRFLLGVCRCRGLTCLNP